MNNDQLKVAIIEAIDKAWYSRGIDVRADSRDALCQPGADERGWLIEVREAPKPLWLKADGSTTIIASDALRFCREQDAEAFLQVFYSAKFGDDPVAIYGRRLSAECYVVTEHIWFAALTAAQSAGKDERSDFETFMLSEYGYVDPESLGYQTSWKAWQARASLAKVEQEPVYFSITVNGQHCSNFWPNRRDAEAAAARLNASYPQDSRAVVPLYDAPQAQQEAVKAAALLETIKEVRDHVVSVVRAFGEKACADYLDNWHKVEHIYAAMQASPAQEQQEAGKYADFWKRLAEAYYGQLTYPDHPELGEGALDAYFEKIMGTHVQADTQQSKKGEGK